MKKQTIIIIVCVAFVIGAAVGLGVSSFYWSRLVGFATVAASTSSVMQAYAPLKLLKDGQTDKATRLLEVELDSAINGLELVSATLNRPDILTNSSVVSAKALK